MKLPRPLVHVAFALLVAACSPPAPSDHAGHGQAVAVDRGARTVTLEHDDIPGLMQAMTMTFSVAPGVDLEGLEPGSEVDFTLRSEGNALTLTAIAESAPR